jgi:exonuclease III
MRRLTAEADVRSRALYERHSNLVGHEDVITIQEVKVETKEAPLVLWEVDHEATIKDAQKASLMKEQYTWEIMV